MGEENSLKPVADNIADRLRQASTVDQRLGR